MSNTLFAMTFLLAGIGAFLGSVSGGYFLNRGLDGRAIEIDNQSSYTITHVFAKPHNSRRGWGEDLLGEEVILLAGKKMTISLDDETNGCRYDLRLVLATRERLLQTNVDVWGAKNRWEVHNTRHEILPLNSSAGVTKHQARAQGGTG
jgi:hypothetical protein